MVRRDDFLSQSERTTLDAMSIASHHAAAAARADGHPVAVFEARGLAKVYHMGEVEVHALRGVDLELYAGEFVVLLGPSGRGERTPPYIFGGGGVSPPRTVVFL